MNVKMFQAMIDEYLPNIIDYGLQAITAIAVFVIGKWIAKRLSSLVKKAMDMRRIDVTVSQFVSNIIYYILTVVVVIAALGQVGVQTASFIAIIGAAGLAIGLALQGSLSNFAAGVMLILFRPCRVGDFVEVAGVSGTVENISIFSTTMHTGDNKTIIIPNSNVMNATIINYSVKAERRVDITVGVSYDAKLDQVKETLGQIVATEGRIIEQREVTIAVSALADSSVNFILRVWVSKGDYWPVTFALNEAIKTRFDEADISIPYPKMDVHLQKVVA